jgi:UDP-N-acetylmuramyl pentapeptide phosphotransferase/UDP-N-acetylglucosamine-1-phosphate transferase
MMIFYYFIQRFDYANVFTSIIPGLTILFIIGLKDDLIGVAPYTKIIAQIASGYFIAAHPSFELINFRGFLWIFQVNFFIGFAIVIAFIIITVNALNLIDGIDGLAGIVSIVIFSSFGVIFFFVGDTFLLSLNIVMIATLLAFLFYNVHKEKKIFMGDTGSLIIGFLVAIMAIALFTISKVEIVNFGFPLQNFPFLIFAILFIPLIDTLRVFMVRIMKGKSPFEADKTHIHHILLPYFNGNHIKTSISIGAICVIIIFLYAFFLIKLNQTNLFLSSILMIVLYFLSAKKLQKNA